jgi:hypothetical protein
MASRYGEGWEGRHRSNGRLVGGNFLAEQTGRIFIVAAVILDGDPEAVTAQCEALERLTLKGTSKWRKTKHAHRIDYLRRVFATPDLQGRLCYAVFRDTQDYETATIDAIARAVRHFGSDEYTTSVYIDALSKSKRHVYGALLRKTGIATHKVQGVTKDENNALVRLADAVTGFVRDGLDRESAEIVRMFAEVKNADFLVEV